MRQKEIWYWKNGYRWSDIGKFNIFLWSMKQIIELFIAFAILKRLWVMSRVSLVKISSDLSQLLKEKKACNLILIPPWQHVRRNDEVNTVLEIENGNERGVFQNMSHSISVAGIDPPDISFLLDYDSLVFYFRNSSLHRGTSRVHFPKKSLVFGELLSLAVLPILNWGLCQNCRSQKQGTTSGVRLRFDVLG